MNKGLIHIYTGDGKGKTTASLGLTLRALGHGFSVCFITFQKDPEKYNYGEFKVLTKLKNVKVYHFVKECPYFNKSYNIKEIKEKILMCVKNIKEKIFKGNYDLIVLDEILVCVREKLLDICSLIELIKSKPSVTELVLTGQANRTIVNKLKNYVDYISYIRNLKHPYDRGIKRRKGIEF